MLVLVYSESKVIYSLKYNNGGRSGNNNHLSGRWQFIKAFAIDRPLTVANARHKIRQAGHTFVTLRAQNVLHRCFDARPWPPTPLPPAPRCPAPARLGSGLEMRADHSSTRSTSTCPRNRELRLRHPFSRPSHANQRAPLCPAANSRAAPRPSAGRDTLVAPLNVSHQEST